MLLSCLDKERVDLLKEEIHIIIWSQQIEKKENDKVFYACYLNLRDEEFLKLRKGIMVFSPEFLSTDYGIYKLKKVFHEIAHHQLNRPMTNIDEVDIKKHEDDADKIAIKKAKEEIHHLGQAQFKAL